MKIGILTLPLHTNYGGILQAWALQIVLKRMGHEPVHIQWRVPKRTPLIRYSLRVIKRCILKVFTSKKIEIFRENRISKEQLILEKPMKPFIDNNINIRYVKNLRDIKEKEYDAFIVGSDQVWRHLYFTMGQNIIDAFLSFTKEWNVKRLSYAASFGKNTIEDEYTPEEIRRCGDLLSNFSLVTVREESGIDICKKYFNIDAIQVVDPTLLLKKEDYQKFISSSKIYNVELFNYILDNSEETDLFIEKVKSKYGWNTFKVNGKVDDLSACLEDRVQKPVSDWLQSFFDAKAIVTDSFHACVFSIIFNKPFLVFVNQKRGVSRFETLLQIIHQENRLISSVEEIEDHLPLLTVQPNAEKYIIREKQKAENLLKETLQ